MHDVRRTALLIYPCTLLSVSRMMWLNASWCEQERRRSCDLCWIGGLTERTGNVHSRPPAMKARLSPLLIRTASSPTTRSISAWEGENLCENTYRRVGMPMLHSTNR